jgi:SAM-dependent methyltransferase
VSVGERWVDLSDVYTVEHANLVDAYRGFIGAIAARIFLEHLAPIFAAGANLQDGLGAVDEPAVSAYRFKRKIVAYLIDTGDVSLRGADRRLVFNARLAARAAELEPRAAELAKRDPHGAAVVGLYRGLGDLAPEIFAGRDGMDAFAQRFGFGHSMQIWEELMMHGPVKPPCTELLVRALTRLLQTSDHPVTVLEGGAGVGSVMRHALQRPRFVEALGNLDVYHFTEISKLLLEIGRERIRAATPAEHFARMRFAPLDLDELDRNEELSRPDALDAVVLEHVLYDLSDLHRGLSTFRRILRPGGILMFTMSYRMRPALSFPIEFLQSTLHSYYRATLQPGRREHHGYLSAVEWKASLEAASFDRFEMYPAPADHPRWPLGGILAFKSDGGGAGFPRRGEEL